MSARQYLYRNLFAFAIAVILLPGGALAPARLAAQRSDQPQRSRANERGPRAVAVIEWQTDSRGRAIPRLIPVVILDGGRFYDASLYRATPVPMALGFGTVYEAQDGGEILGYLTVKNAARASAKALSNADADSIADERPWIGTGDWKTASPAADGYSNRPQHAEIVRTMAGSTSGPIVDNSNASAPSGDDRNSRKESTTVYDEQGREVSPNPDDSRPTLKRRGDSDRSKNKEGTPRVAPPDAAKTKTGSTGDDPDRPRLKRQTTPSGTSSSSPDPSSDSTSSPASTTSPNQSHPESSPASTNSSSAGSDSSASVDADPNRPVLRRGKAPEQVKADSDADRPDLKRKGNAGGASIGRSGEKKASSAKGPVGAPVPQRVIDRGTRPLDETNSVALRTRTYEAVAVSDARIVENAPVYRHRWAGDEEAEVTRRMTALAESELQKFLPSAGGASPAAMSTKPASPLNSKVQRRAGTAARTSQNPAAPGIANATLEDLRVKELDISSNNSSEVIFTARRRTSAKRYAYITLVARMDLDGNPRKLFSSVTTSDRLDSIPRLEFIDAVDVDGDGRGELLFRAVKGGYAEFVIYRVGPDKLMEIFHGGEAG